uniref:Uncharacterized protein n=1 Tax=Romanomermis culicivorax TaxID=13658 RepID=A0A915KKN9_ROMCU
MDPSTQCQLTAQQILDDYSTDSPSSMTILTPDSLKTLTSASFTLPSVLGRFNVQTSDNAASLCGKRLVLFKSCLFQSFKKKQKREETKIEIKS